MKVHKHILPVIVISQFFCTSLWFAGNAVISDLMLKFNISEQALGPLSSSVQFGFIVGALVFAMLCLADRFSPSKVFFICSVIAALANVGITWSGNTLTTILILRFITGFFLAGIYPVGMKIAADYYKEGLGKSLGFLVGALVLGTALPHLLKDIPQVMNSDAVFKITSILAITGGVLMMVLVPDGPYRKVATALDFKVCFSVFKDKKFRGAAFGYFGHMWELYAFWTFVPVMLVSYQSLHEGTDFSVSMMSFLIIGIGSFSCVLGGYLANKYGSEKVAFVSLLISCLCCLLSPLFFLIQQQEIFVSVLLIWGMAVIADSPLFSTLVAQHVDAENKGTGLTIVTCVGFAITILSIQLLNEMVFMSTWVYMILAIGPLMGLYALRKYNF